MTKKTVSTPKPADVSQVDPSKVPLSQIILGLTTGQAWKLGGTLLAIILAAVAGGKWVESWERDKAISAAIGPKDQTIKDLSGENERLKALMVTTTSDVENLNMRLIESKRFVAFADKYLTYVSTGEEPARSIFAGHVCMLYRESQQADLGLSMITTTVARTIENVDAVGSRDLLIALGVDPDLVRELIELKNVGIRRNLPSISRTVGYGVEPSVARVSPFSALQNQLPIPANDPRAQKVATDVTKRVSGNSGQLIKVVTFHVEGRDYSYTMPPEIAGLVHNNPDCLIN